MSVSDELVQVWIANGEIDAQLVHALLTSHGIDCSLAGETLRLTHGFNINKLGQVKILVRASDAEDARRVLEEAGSGSE